jgi:UDP-glucose 4-epimerase
MPIERFCWDGGPVLASQIAHAVREFASQIGTADRWEIYWAAGVGAMSSLEEQLVPETWALSQLLGQLQKDSCLMAVEGAVCLASSAGALYAGSTDDVISENTLPVPNTAYAREKLKQENLLRLFASQNENMTAFIARISTLYGPGQHAGKRQGLLTHIARSIVRNDPVQIYVPYDTIRDYICSDDAASAMITVLRSIHREERVLVKIVASERPTTIAEIVAIFKRISRQKPRIVTSANRLSSLYSRRVQFRSIELPECILRPPRSLSIGIFQLLTEERHSFFIGPIRGSTSK